MSVLDHGVTINLDTVPKLDYCSKFTIIGNSKMRVKRRLCEPDPGPLWQVPVPIRETYKDQAEEEEIKSARRPRTSHVTDPTPLVAGKRKHRRFNEAFEINRLDASSIYTAKSQEFIVLPPLAGRESNPGFQKEKEVIREYHHGGDQDFFKSPSPTKQSKLSLSIRLPRVSDTMNNRDNNDDKSLSTSSRKLDLKFPAKFHRYHDNIRPMCDVIGPRYCYHCRRIYRSKLAVKSNPVKSV